MPEWFPSGREGRTAELLAWIKMIKALDGHEARHRQLGETWRGILEKRFQSVHTTVSGQDATDAATKLSEKLGKDQQKWQDDAQAAQKKLDKPRFTGAVLACPVVDPKAPLDALAPQPDKISQGAPAQPAKLDDGKAPAQPKPLDPELQKLFPDN
jgi:hypothetical protein